MTYTPSEANDSGEGVARWVKVGLRGGGQLMDAGGSIGGDGFTQEGCRGWRGKGCNTCTWHGQCIRYPTNA